MGLLTHDWSQLRCCFWFNFEAKFSLKLKEQKRELERNFHDIIDPTRTQCFCHTSFSQTFGPLYLIVPIVSDISCDVPTKFQQRVMCAGESGFSQTISLECLGSVACCVLLCGKNKDVCKNKAKKWTQCEGVIVSSVHTSPFRFLVVIGLSTHWTFLTCPLCKERQHT